MRPMKKIIIISAVLALAIFNCEAQPNPGFENWSTVYNIEEPDNWQTMNIMSLVCPPDALTAFKATGVDKHSGNYALKLITVYSSNNPIPQYLRDTAGYLFTGKVNLSPPALKYGYAFTDRPEKMDFYAKYHPVGGNTAQAGVLLSKWNGVKQDTIGIGSVKIPAAAAYTLFQIYISYSSTVLPDTAVIFFS